MQVELDTAEALMGRYQNGSVEAFEELYARSVGRVRSWLSRRIEPRERVEDCVQKVFLKLHHARHQFRVDEVFEAWLFSIVRSVWLDELRHLKRHPDQMQFVPLEDLVESRVPQVEGRADEAPLPELELALGRLSNTHREALDMRYQQGLSFGGIAQRWRVTEAAARKRVSRAVLELKDLVRGETERSSPTENSKGTGVKS